MKQALIALQDGSSFMMTDELGQRARVRLAQGLHFEQFETEKKGRYRVEATGLVRVLAQVQGSVLWLVQDNDSAADNLRREAATRGISPDRLIFATRLPPAEHLARQRLAGLFLDTFPYNGGTTTTSVRGWRGAVRAARMS